jgi:hypothetical protein
MSQLTSFGKKRGVQISEFAKIVGYDPSIWQTTDTIRVVNREISSPEEYSVLMSAVTDVYEDLFRKVFYETFHQTYKILEETVARFVPEFMFFPGSGST